MNKKQKFYLRDDETFEPATAPEAFLQERLIEAREDLFTIGLIGMKAVLGDEFVDEIQNELVKKGVVSAFSDD